MFPSLVNCCSIDWYMDWPQDALLSVAQDSLSPLGEEGPVNNLPSLCVLMHEVGKAL
jgi:dynein heavy chain